MQRAAVRHHAVYTTPVEHHNPMEPHATLASWDGDKLMIYESTQGVSNTQKALAQIFQIDAKNIRVVSHFLGGGFGCKGQTWPHTAIAAMAARVVDKPVKLVLTRPQMFASNGHRAQTIQTVDLASSKDGKLLAIRHDILNHTSMLDNFVESSGSITEFLYACPNVDVSHRLARLNFGTPTFTRAPGFSSGAYALESAMDEMAYKLGIDPLQFRLRNYAERDEHEQRPWSSKSLRQCYERGAAKFGWNRRKSRPGSMRDGRYLVGYGMASATYPAHFLPAGAKATMALDGSVLVQCGTQDIGTGTYTVMAQVAARALGVSPQRVRFELGDTLLPPAPAPGSTGSATVASVGSAVLLAANSLRDSQEQGHDKPQQLGGQQQGNQHVTGRHSYQVFGAQFCEVRVDPILCEIRVARMTGCFAGGRVLNARTAKSQLMGGMVWGIGMALTEQTRMDETRGCFTNANLSEYLLPTHADVPDIEVVLVEEHDPFVNPLGAKGLGEIGIVGAAAAIANAVYHATGIRVRDLPITPDKLLDLRA